MSVTMICPNLSCGRTVVAPEASRGQVVRCVYCDRPLVVPAKRKEPAVEAEESPPAKGSRSGARN